MTSRELEIVQLLVGHMQNFTYLLSNDGHAAVVDPSFGGQVAISEASRRGCVIDLILSTHSHFDHVNDIELVRGRTGARVYAHTASPVDKDISLEDESQITLGDATLKVLETPGHTPDSVCFLSQNTVFTGDTLFVGTCGRADLPGSDPRQLYRSLKRLGQLPGTTVVYPGHDYGATKTSTIARELLENPAMQQESEEAFEAFVLS